MAHVVGSRQSRQPGTATPRMTSNENDTLQPNETLYVDIEINRRVDEEVFRLDPAADGSQDFKDQEPSEKIVK